MVEGSMMNWSMVDRPGMVKRGMMGCRMMWGPCWVGRSTFISDVRYVPVVVVGCVSHNLNAAVRQGNPKTTLLLFSKVRVKLYLLSFAPFFISSQYCAGVDDEV